MASDWSGSSPLIGQSSGTESCNKEEHHHFNKWLEEGRIWVFGLCYESCLRVSASVTQSYETRDLFLAQASGFFYIHRQFILAHSVNRKMSKEKRKEEGRALMFSINFDP